MQDFRADRNNFIYELLFLNIDIGKVSYEKNKYKFLSLVKRDFHV